MICKACKAEMKLTVFEGQVIHYCDDCRSFWVDDQTFGILANSFGDDIDQSVFVDAQRLDGDPGFFFYREEVDVANHSDVWTYIAAHVCALF